MFSLRYIFYISSSRIKRFFSARRSLEASLTYFKLKTFLYWKVAGNEAQNQCTPRAIFLMMLSNALTVRGQMEYKGSWISQSKTIIISMKRLVIQLLSIAVLSSRTFHFIFYQYRRKWENPVWFTASLLWLLTINHKKKCGKMKNHKQYFGWDKYFLQYFHITISYFPI